MLSTARVISELARSCSWIDVLMWPTISFTCSIASSTCWMSLACCLFASTISLTICVDIRELWMISPRS